MNEILKFVTTTKNLIFTKKVQSNFKIYYQAYHGSKFSGKMKNLNSVDFQGECIKAHKFKRNFSAQYQALKSINLLGCKIKVIIKLVASDDTYEVCAALYACWVASCDEIGLVMLDVSSVVSLFDDICK